MDDESLDVEATRRVANRALVSSGLAFASAVAGGTAPLSSAVVIPFELVVGVVAISAMRTLNHPEARVIGDVRHVGIVLAALALVAAGLGLALRIVLLARAP
jgi:hypothetical protein